MPRVATRLLLAVVAALMATGGISFRPAPVAAVQIGTGTVSLTTIGGLYNQHFDTLANTAGTTHTALPDGWYLDETGTSTRVNSAYAVSTGSDNAGDIYSFGAAAATDRAFGTLRSGTLSPIIGGAFTNNTGATITSLDIGFIGEMWRAGVENRGAADRLDFEYSTDATSLSTGTWTAVDALDYLSTSISTSPNGPKNGNDSSFRAAVFNSITGLTIANGATFWIRWLDFDISSSDDGLGIDNFALTPQTSVVPQLSINNVAAFEGNAGTATFQFTVSLTSPTAAPVTFDIGTADGSATDADTDYEPNSQTGQSIPAGSTTATFDVTVNGDVVGEFDETFDVNVTNVAGATLTDGLGVGTIRNDDSQCDLVFTPIYTIQGTGLATTPGVVTTEGVVIGDYEGTAADSFEGFYIQDLTGDGLATTSDGIFVYSGAGVNHVNLGDVVRVTGFARERFNQTTINGSNANNAGVTILEKCGTASAPAPVDVTMPLASSTYLERFEGMMVRFPQALVISEFFNYDRFGELVLALPYLEGETRPFGGTAIDEPGVGPGSPANIRTAANLLRRVTLDDGLDTQNPQVTRHPNGDPFSLDNRFRGGDTVANATGVLGFDFSLYRIQPTAPANYVVENPRPAAPEETDGRLTVAAMNTLNFFLTPDIDGNPPVPVPGVVDNSCGTNQNLECRGWDSSQPAEFNRQRDKVIAALMGLDADIIGLNELENTPGVDPAANLAAGLNEAIEDATGDPGTYVAITTGTLGTDAIRVGLIYRADIVSPVGDEAVLTSAVDPRFLESRSRPAVAQTFEENATGERFTVIVNHLKSKGSACTPDDPDIGDGQGNCNQTRLNAAKALVDWAATDPTDSGDPDFVIMGDLNSYAKEDPIDAIKAGADDTAGTADDWTNLIEQYIGPYAYSFVFDGQSGYLDHALSNASLTGQVTGAAEWHINADEPDLLDYDTSFKSSTQDTFYEPNQFRASDHDPVLIGLDLDSAPTIVVDGGGICGGVTSTVLVTVDDLVTDPGDLAFTFTGSSNTALVPNAGVALGGSGSDRTIGVTPDKGSGTAVLSFELSDGTFTVPFTLTVKVGTDGNDSISGTAGADLILGLQGNDALSGLGDGDLLCGGNGVDSLAGGDGVDTLDGANANDVLSGGAGDDVLRGGFGIDSLTGGSGADFFSGGFGADVFVDFDAGEGDSSDGS